MYKDEELCAELLDIENIEFTILEDGVNILSEENQNTNLYTVITVNNSANSELRIVNETSLNSTSLVEPIDIAPDKFSID